jgi:uncharacterized membrane protein YhhN
MKSRLIVTLFVDNYRYTFSRRILTGLLFSCLGDALLCWPQYFTHGMTAFGVAQIMYTAAFGFEPLNAMLGAALYTFGAMGELHA